MDPIAVEAQLRNTFLATLGSDASLYEGTKQQFIMRFNNESRNIANGMIAQANQRGSAINNADYQSVALDLLNRYKQSIPQQQQYAVPMQQPAYPQQYAAPMMQPMMVQPQPAYGMPMQPMYRPQPVPFTNLQYQRPQQYAMPIQQPMYTPMQPTMTQPMTGSKPLYGGALPANAAPAQTGPMAAPVVPNPPMTVVQPVAPATQAQQPEPQVVQPTTATYAIPQIVKRHMFSDKTPQPIKGDIITYQKDNGELLNVVVASTTAMLTDVDAVVKSLAKKKNAIDVTLRYTPYELVAGDLADMQQSFIAVKKIIADARKEQNIAPSEIIGKIVEYCDAKTKGVAKHIENTILGIYNAYASVANSSNDSNCIVPDADQLECLQSPGTAAAEKYISMALSEFEQYSIYDPSSSQVAAWLKDVDILADASFTDLKKNKDAFTKWAKSHCIIKKPIELYRFSAVDHETTDVTQHFGYTNSTPPDDALEFFTIEALNRDPARVVTMITKDGKSFITNKGTIDRSNGTIHVEFE